MCFYISYVRVFVHFCVRAFVRSFVRSFVLAFVHSCFRMVSKRMVKLRNPWGKVLWSGAWSKSSPEWANHPDVASTLLVQYCNRVQYTASSRIASASASASAHLSVVNGAHRTHALNERSKQYLLSMGARLLQAR